jgi:hypothetical protein
MKIKFTNLLCNRHFLSFFGEFFHTEIKTNDEENRGRKTGFSNR